MNKMIELPALEFGFVEAQFHALDSVGSWYPFADVGSHLVIWHHLVGPWPLTAQFTGADQAHFMGVDGVHWELRYRQSFCITNQ